MIRPNYWPNALSIPSMPIIPATERSVWHALLAHFEPLDPTYVPEYHLAYSLRIKDSKPLLWHFELGGEHFIYPFLLTPVVAGNKPTGYYDISGIYGYTGPIATSDSQDFLKSTSSAEAGR